MNASISSEPSKGYYDQCKNQMGQGIRSNQWLIYRERSHGVEWKVIGKPLRIVRNIYKLLGWNLQLENVSNAVCQHFTTYKDQSYFDENCARIVLSRLMQKSRLDSRGGKLLADLNKEIQRKSEQQKFVQIKEFSLNVIPNEIVNDVIFCFLSSDDKKTLGLVSKTFRALVQQQTSPEVSYLTKVLYLAKSGNLLSLPSLHLSFNLGVEGTSFKSRSGEYISFESFKKLFPEKFNFPKVVKELFKLYALIEPNSNEEKLLIYLMEHIPSELTNDSTTKWIDGSNVPSMILKLEIRKDIAKIEKIKFSQ